MKLIFDWCADFYESQPNWNDSEKVISLEVYQKECGFALAKVVLVAKNSSQLLSKQYARIGVQFDNEQIYTLFTGRVVSFPAGLGGATVTIELISEPPDYQRQLIDFCTTNLKGHKSQNKHDANSYQFDELFFSPDDLHNPTAFLESENRVFYWDMKNGKMLLSDINSGSKQVLIDGNDILQNSLKIRLSREPYKCINLTITASWIQYESGIIDLIPMIASCFPFGKINSFTNIQSSLKNLCKFHENSGYSVLYNNVKETPPGGIGQYPQTSPEFFVNEKPIKLKRFYFSGQLICGWHYKQKRTENLHVKIVNNHSKYGRTKDLYFKLNGLQLPRKHPTWLGYTHYAVSDSVIYSGRVFKCKENHISSQTFDETKWELIYVVPDAIKNEACRSFFAENRGQNAIKYAIRRAIALINYSSRYIEVDFCVHAEKFLMDINLDNSVKISDSRFPDGCIEGKVIKTKFVADADQKLLKVTIGCRGNCKLDCNAANEKLSTPIPIHAESTEGINPTDIVTGIEVKHLPAEQIEVLQSSSFSSIQHVKETLKKYVTKIKVILHPQNTMRELTKNIVLPDFVI